MHSIDDTNMFSKVQCALEKKYKLFKVMDLGIDVVFEPITPTTRSFARLDVMDDFLSLEL
jgi:hypothetical protein